MKTCLNAFLAGILSVSLAGILRADDKPVPASAAPQAAPAVNPNPSAPAAPAVQVNPAPPAAPAVSPVVTPPAAPAVAPAAVKPAKAADVSVSDLAVGTGVQDRVLQGSAKSFQASVTNRVYCFGKIAAKSAPTVVRYAWSKDGKKLDSVEIKVGGNPWRTWSTHAVDAGAWKVEILDAQDQLVDSIEFTVAP